MHWKGLQKPKRLEWDEETYTDSYGKCYIDPLERGFGITIGNSMRRVLLSHLKGCAVTSVKVNDIRHEFCAIEGLKEDAEQLILNLKKLLLKMKVDHPKIISLDVTAPKDINREIYASDIKIDEDVEVLNKDLYLATVEKGGRLKLDLSVKWGRGYKTAEENLDIEEETKDFIAMDALFSPIQKVNFKVDNIRVGQRTDYDKLILEIWTNGSVVPRDSIAYSAKILKDYFDIFINFEEIEEEEIIEEEIDTENEELVNNLLGSVEKLELTARAQNCLKNANIKSICDLVQKTESEMLATRNFGKISLQEIKDNLKKLGLQFGMNLDHLNIPKAPRQSDEVDTK